MRSLILVYVIVGLIAILSIVNAQADETLVLYYTFDEGSGDEARDSSQYGNDGVMVPAADWVDGKFGGAIQITAAAGHVEVTPTDSLHGDILMGTFTLTAFISPALSDTWGHIWRSRPVESGHNTLFVNNTGFMSWRGMVGGAWTTLCESAPGSIFADEWQHVAVVSDEANFMIYINGEMAIDSAFAETDGAIETFYVGGDGQSENYTGAIDEVTVWSRALTQDEIGILATHGMEAIQAVDPAYKLATTWGEIKGYR
jgi:hypothetical protein